MKIWAYIKLLRLHQLTGVWLLYLPGCWSLSLAYNKKLPISLYIKFLIGSFLMRAAGCIINDISDIDIDRQVTRTKNRPLACGELTIKQALLVLFILLFAALILLIQFNKATVIIGCLAMIPIAVYPLMKRVTYLPQLFLGFTFNISALMGWSAVTNNIGLAAILIYLAAIFWTLSYDTIYAHQDKVDDVLIGVKSTAIKFDNYSKCWIKLFYYLMILCLFVAGYLVSLNYIFFIGLFIVSFCITYFIKNLDLNDPVSCAKAFRSNTWLGIVILMNILIGRL